MSARKIARNIAKKEAKELKKETRMNPLTWDTLNNAYVECGQTIAKNAILVRTLLDHTDLANADELSINRVRTITAKVTNELHSKLADVHKIVNGRTGKIQGYDQSETDYDDALVVFDLYSNMVDNIAEQYSYITDALYTLKQQLVEEAA